MNADLKQKLFRELLRIRLVEEKIAALYPEQDMRCPTHLSIGQEGVAVGACAALRRDDQLFGTYRSHALYLAKGGDLKAMLAEIYGSKSGCCGGKSGSMQLVAPEEGLLCSSAIVGGTIPMAVGAALANRLRKNDAVSCVVFGDAATEEGVFHESMNFATLKKLPVIFVCENNLFAVYTHISKRQASDRIADRMRMYELPSQRFDGNNTLEVFDAVSTAVARARRGEGPSFLEFMTYRWLEHVGPNSDVPLGVRTQQDLDAWKAKDPLVSLEKSLIKESLLTGDAVERYRRDIAKEIDEAVQFAKTSPFPDPEAVSQDVYA
jgi:pyruvate dehydrogenase E1 component alpha subunit